MAIQDEEASKQVATALARCSASLDRLTDRLEASNRRQEVQRLRTNHLFAALHDRRLPTAPDPAAPPTATIPHPLPTGNSPPAPSPKPAPPDPAAMPTATAYRAQVFARTILVQIHWEIYPISCKVLDMVFSRFGVLEYVAKLSPGMGFHSKVRFKTEDSALQALNFLNGRNIYDGCCRLELSIEVPPEESMKSEFSPQENPIKRDMPDIDAREFQIQRENERKDELGSFAAEIGSCSKGKMIKDDANEDLDMINGGNLSDPGTKGEHWTPPKLKRSCSSLDTREVLKKIVGQLPSKSQSYEQLQELAEVAKEDVLPSTPMSQTSAMSHFSADKVMLKKCSSSQILPSRSRRLWWKLFLWSHRNLQKPLGVKTRPAHGEAFNQLGGYSS